jgi:hypothetical protein
LATNRERIASTLVVLALLAPAAACWDAAQGQTVVAGPDASEAAFGPVADYLDHRCGTLDCHGQIGRDLRVYGCYGMRLDAADVPDCVKEPTTPDEHAATYRSLVGLEPEVMNEVVQGHGAHPELLTFVRKARGTETHKGGQLITPGDVQDTCIVSWLAGATDTSACVQALAFPMFPGVDGGVGTSDGGPAKEQ